DPVKRAKGLWPEVHFGNSNGMSDAGDGNGTRSAEQVLKPGCAGKLPANKQVRDENRDVITENSVVGEMYGWQKHPRRYWNDEDASVASFAGGWTKTGDLGFVDEDGDLIMAGR